MRESLEDSPFETVPTEVPGLDSCVLWVPEREIREDTVKTLGTTLEAFMPGISKGRGLDDGYGAYVLSRQGASADGWRAFWFAKVRTPEEIAVAFRTERDDRAGIPWAGVLLTPTAANLTAYDDGVSYVQGTVWDFVWADKPYDGVTKVVVSYYVSHTNHDIPDPVEIQPMGGTFDYGVSSVTVPECLHGEFTLEYEIGESSIRPAQTFSRLFLATTPATRPATMILEDGERFQDGVFIRRQVVAYAP